MTRPGIDARTQTAARGAQVHDVLRDDEAFVDLINAARDKSRVTGLTHNFYRYPARFSPTFVRSAIRHFTDQGDLIFDPFMGGGTTIVEALSSGRRAIGVDISSLASFVTCAKTRIFTDSEFNALDAWSRALYREVNIHGRAVPSSDYDYEEAGYHRHLKAPVTWRIRKALEQVLQSASRLPSKKLETFARCVALRTGQWALDGRKQIPSIREFRRMLGVHAGEMIAGAKEFRTAVRSHGDTRLSAVCINRSVIGIEAERHFDQGAPKLVLTSPPYPGVHVLYHRWQVNGGKETAAPFWLADKLDGSGAAYYTLGDRHAADHDNYFESLRSALTSVANVCDSRTVIIQVVAFSNPQKQLARYLRVVEDAGFEELQTPSVPGELDGRLWRTIPNRRWHAGMLGAIPASQEVVLFHRKSC